MKKVIYILNSDTVSLLVSPGRNKAIRRRNQIWDTTNKTVSNLLFLTLSVFGGSVFAAAPPTEYIDAKGETQPLSTVPTSLTTSPVGGNWYYLDSSTFSSSTVGIIIGASAANNPVNIIISEQVSLPTASSGSYIKVPENTYVNFYGATTGSSLTIQNSYTTYVIGNNDSDFGGINFISGNYTIKNTSTGVPIGSNNNSGGSITINAAANVTAYSNVAGAGTVSVGVVGENKCNITVDGGFLSSVVKDNPYTINAGGGSLTVTGQGRVLTTSNAAYNVQELVADSTWDIQSGVVGYYDLQSTSTQSKWNAIVGGEITVPNPNEDVLSTDLLNLQVPTFGTGGNQFWYTLTVLDNAELTLGTTADPAVFYVSGSGTPNSYVNNFGTVNIVNINQNSYYPVSWNNLPGSVLTVSEGAGLTVYSLTNGSNSPSQEPSTINIDGNLIIQSGYTINNVTNYSQLNISQTGNVQGPVVNGSNTPDSPGASLTLDGEITGTLTNYSSSSVTVGPIGTVEDTFTNSVDGTVTSQNPCYIETR